jgi:hypothetical protein
MDPRRSLKPPDPHIIEKRCSSLELTRIMPLRVAE